MLFSLVAESIYIPTNNPRGSPFLYTLSSNYFCIFFINHRTDGCKVIHHVVLMCDFLIISNDELLFPLNLTEKPKQSFWPI